MRDLAPWIPRTSSPRSRALPGVVGAAVGAALMSVAVLGAAPRAWAQAEEPPPQPEARAADTAVDTTAAPENTEATAAHEAEAVLLSVPLDDEPAAAQEVEEELAPVERDESDDVNIRESLVRVHSGSHRANGFFFERGDRVVTSAAIARDGGVITVILPNGSTQRAVATHVEDGLAFLRVEEERPFLVSGGAVLGEAVRFFTGRAMVGRHPQPQTELTAILTGVSGRWITAGVEISPWASGSPVISERGQVVGVVVGQRILSAAILNERISDDYPHDPPSRWRIRFGIDLQARYTPHYGGHMGAMMELGIMGYDRFGFALRAGVMSKATYEDEGVTRSFRHRFEGAFELQLHHAFGHGRLTLALGGTVFNRVDETRTPTLQIPGGCDPSAGACDVQIIDRVDEESRWRIRPHARLEMTLQKTVLSYQAIFETSDILLTTHVFGLGFRY